MMLNRRQMAQSGLTAIGAGLVVPSAFALSAEKPTAAAAKMAAPATSVTLQAGRDFKLVKPTAPTEAAAGKVEVVEFFWYKCSHCFHFEPELNAWIKTLPAHVSFRRVPVGFNASFIPQQKLFYALEGLNLLGTLHSKIFAAIHTEQIKLDNDADIFAWVVKQGVNLDKFKAMYTSFSVAGKVSRATKLQDAYQVDGVPAMGVDGKFLSNGTLTGSMPRLLQVVGVLAAQKR